MFCRVDCMVLYSTEIPLPGLPLKLLEFPYPDLASLFGVGRRLLCFILEIIFTGDKFHKKQCLEGGGRAVLKSQFGNASHHLGVGRVC